MTRAEAARELDALGWKLNGQFREKDGRQLVIRHLFYDAQGGRAFAQIAQHSLAQIGVKLDLVARSGNGFFTQLRQRRGFRYRHSSAGLATRSRCRR